MLLRMWIGEANGSGDRHVSVTGQAGFTGCHSRRGFPEAGHGVAVLLTLEPFSGDGKQHVSLGTSTTWWTRTECCRRMGRLTGTS